MAGAKKPVLYGDLIMRKRNDLQPIKNANTFSNLLYLQYFTMTLQRPRTGTSNEQRPLLSRYIQQQVSWEEMPYSNQVQQPQLFYQWATTSPKEMNNLVPDLENSHETKQYRYATGCEKVPENKMIFLLYAWTSFELLQTNLLGYLPELGTRQDCPDNMTMFSGFKIVW